MTREDLARTVKQMIARETDLPVDGVTESTSLVDIGVDSLDVLKLAVAFEQRFNITITTAELTQLRSFGDILDELERKAVVV